MARFATLVFVLVGGVVASAFAPAAAADVGESFDAKVLPVLAARCVGCHGGDKPDAKLDLSQPRTTEQLEAEEERWFRVLQRIEDGSMPPAGEAQPTDAERRAIVAWTRTELTPHLANRQLREGRSKFRRLSRSEYADTIHDLFGFRPAAMRDLPGDGRVDGYDKVSAALPLSSASASGYVKLADDILAHFLTPPQKDSEERAFRLWAGPSEQSAGHILELDDGTKVSFNTDTTSGPLRRKSPDGKLVAGSGIRRPGVHKLRLSVYAYQTDEPLPFGIYIGHTGAYPQILELAQVLEAPPGKPAVLETEVYFRTRLNNDLAPVSDHFRLIPFGLGVQVPKNSQASDCKGPGLAVQWVEVEEPESPLAGEALLCAEMTPELREAFLKPSFKSKNKKGEPPSDEVTQVVERTIRRVGARLFRRDLTDSEASELVQRFVADYQAGGTLRTAFLAQIGSLLTAPDFLCLVERPGRLDDFALASRLSYFLWNSTPDEELLAVARSGRLVDSQTLRQETERLLRDPRSARFVKNFLDQWLGLWGIDNTTPDKDLYPGYDELLKVSSMQETQATFRRLLDENRSVREFVDPGWALVNRRLAEHYDLPAVRGVTLQEVKLTPESPFGGVWTQAAVMKVTANGTLTSPVKRGVWVAERLLGQAIPPPPPNVDPVDPDTRGAKTLREQLALHSSQGSCKACHAKFDPYGFALESFDVVGRYRTKYRTIDPEFAKLPPGERKGRNGVLENLPVDCSGTMPDGTPFADVRELRRRLAADPAQLARGVTRHLLTYATGAAASPIDQPTIEAVVAATAAEEYGLRALVHGVVQSDVFRHK